MFLEKRYNSIDIPENEISSAFHGAFDRVPCSVPDGLVRSDDKLVDELSFAVDIIDKGNGESMRGFADIHGAGKVEAHSAGASTCEFCDTCGAAPALHKNDFSCRCLTLDPRLLPIIEAWVELPESLKTAVEAICFRL